MPAPEEGSEPAIDNKYMILGLETRNYRCIFLAQAYYTNFELI